MRKPGQLILELAAELRTHAASTRHDELFAELERRVVELHEALSGEPPSGEPLAHLRRAGFERILSAFADALRLLPQPVVLILDTCEELARIRPVAGMLPSVEADLRDPRARPRSAARAAGGLRRPAAARPAWRRLADRGLQPHGGAALVAVSTKAGCACTRSAASTRPKRAVFIGEIRGPASRARARAGDSRAQPRNRPRGPEIDWQPPREEENNERFNPFDLALYTDWLRAEPALEAATLARDEADPYVEIRIVRRIRHDETRQLLPAVWRCGVSTARCCAAPRRGSMTTPCGRSTGGSATRSGSTTRSGPGPGGVLEVSRRLWPRLRSFYRQPAQRAAYDAAVRRLAPEVA